MDEATLAFFADAKYVLLTTYRKNGDGVGTPVWIARDGDHLEFGTESESWKVKRMRNNSTVQITVCDARGRVSAGAHTASATASILADAASVEANKAVMNAKYGIANKLILFAARFKKGTSSRAVIELR